MKETQGLLLVIDILKTPRSQYHRRADLMTLLMNWKDAGGVMPGLEEARITWMVASDQPFPVDDAVRVLNINPVYIKG